ncbi:hypothetical protein [Solidesulfovibrio sp.]|uniref:hypothetical protein n=1 Tax=Solidesulfovibrio sp. TaxID=2910990 RepID=UPI002635E8B0|nr:hypothetical protein [Solidesulfovibrio sp.]
MPNNWRRLMGRFAGTACVLVLGLGIGWAAATWRATHEMRDRDAAALDVSRERVDAEEMRLLDLDPEQRRRFQETRNEVFLEMQRLIGRSRPEIEGILRRSDEKIRPMLSPRQLAIYDRLEKSRRQGLPERPVGADD